ncbi:hypothetical protein Efla_002310 [Eimeria flavescens]
MPLWSLHADEAAEEMLARLPGADDEEAAYVFDNNVMSHGIPLSELYLALLKLQLKDAMSISQQYEIFKAKKAAYNMQVAESLRKRNRKLKLISYALQAANEGAADADIASLGFTGEALAELKSSLAKLMSKQSLMKLTLERLEDDPDSYQGEDVELEWVAEADREPTDEEPDSSSASEKASEQALEPSEDDDSDWGEAQKFAKVVGYDCDDWIEDEV